MTYPYQVQWHSRSKMIANMIPANSSVIDLGAGEGTLKQYLKGDYLYTAVDKYKCTNETIVANFNDEEYPDFSDFDVIVAQGIIEYLDKPEDFLRIIKTYASTLIVTYRTEVGNPAEERKNAFSFTQFISLLTKTNWNIIEIKSFSPRQAIFLCEHLELHS